MSINYENEILTLITQLERNGYSIKTLAEHRRCFDELKKHLLETDTQYSTESALNWLEIRKLSWSYDTYKRYRRALYRFEKYLRTGEISSEPHCYNNFFAYRDTDVAYIKLPDKYKSLYQEFHSIISGERAKGTVDHYIAGCTDFLLFLAEQGCNEPSEITAQYPLEYLNRINEMMWSNDTKKKYAEGVAQLLTYFAAQGFVPRCYARIVKRHEDESDIRLLKLNDTNGSAFQPSKSLETHIDAFLLKLQALRYNEPQKLYGYIFTDFCLFLEVNRIEYSTEVVDLWLNHIPKNSGWTIKRKKITQFSDYMTTGILKHTSNYVWKTLLIDKLPEWSRKITYNYLELRQKEGWELSTLRMCRSSCVRFFRFLDSKGVNNSDEITPSLVKEFHNTDPHTTPEGRNAYGVRVRKMLEYMADENLVSPNLYLAIGTQCAPKRGIVTVMSEEMINAVYHYRESATTPGELRATAMVMLSLRMGLRSSDIVNLKIGDFDLTKRKLAIVQAKTRKAITLPIPIDVGNSVFKYITQGRPQSSELGIDFIFIRHTSPYSPLDSTSCNCALANILSAQGLELPSGQGFHITRRTFATRLLQARTQIDLIVDALGHSNRMAVDNYLLHDEDGMRLCPLSFRIGGSQ